MLNENQESRDAIQLKKFTEENCLQFQAEVSFNTRDGVRRPLCFTIQNHHNYTLTEVANCIKA